MKAEDIVIYSDMDGTMLTDWSLGPVVPERNLTAVREFLRQGGSFSVATGRQYTDTLDFFPDIRFDAPAVLGNGAVLYDCRESRVVQVSTLPQSYKEESLRYLLGNPDVGFVAADLQDVYQVDVGDPLRDRALPDRPRAHMGIKDYLERGIVKLVYVTEELPIMERVLRETAALPSAHLVNACLSEARYYEVFSRETDKATGIRRAVTLAGLQSRTLVCIGDYYNDESMLRAADIAACPRNAPRAIRELCSLVTCSNNEGAVADLIKKLCGF